MWAIDLVCVQCRHPLRSKGLYQRIRVVIDVKDCYYLVGEYMYCSSNNGCKSTYISWDKWILD